MLKISALLLFLFSCDDLNQPLSSEYNTSNYKNSNSAHLNYIDLSIRNEKDFYITPYILPEQAPYVMEIDIIAKTNSDISQEIKWYTNREYSITECPDYWECPYIYDLMADSTTTTNKLGRSVNTIRVSPEFANDTIYVYSYFTDDNGTQSRGKIKLFLYW